MYSSRYRTTSATEPWWRSVPSGTMISRSSGGPSYSFSNSTFCRDGRTRAFPDELFTGPNNPLLRTDDSDSDDGAEQNMQQKAAVKTQDLQQKARPKQAQAQAQAKGPIKIKDIKFDEEENYKTHAGSQEYTDGGCEGLVLRRGQPFQVTLTFSRAYDKEADKLILQVYTGKRPSASSDTLFRMHVSDKLTDEWSTRILSSDGNDVTLELMIPADAIVGKYYVFAEVNSKENKKISRRRSKNEIYILFNAWCKDDPVYMENEDERQEYVLNDQGHVYRGNIYRRRPKPWDFGQFEDICLKAAIQLLEKSYLKKRAHSNPIQVMRALSAMANSIDNDGVLEGNWSGDYTNGISPLQWSSSVNILKKYMGSKKPVQYGQCWVFSALLTTLCRTLGIPTRSVTNFESAHDSDFTCTIDSYVDEDGKPKPYLDSESIWNFHVWNEAWVARQDLPDGYDGWQAFDSTPQEASEDETVVFYLKVAYVLATPGRRLIPRRRKPVKVCISDTWQVFDSTPQEASEGVMRCGPAPVIAVKKGEVYLNYDTLFIYAEVNGDKVTWMTNCEGEFEAVEVQTNEVGKHISTKAVGTDDCEDITHHYKYPEGSEEERAAMRRASSHSKRNQRALAKLYQHVEKDVEFKLTADAKKTGDIDYTLSASNTSGVARTITIKMHTVAKYYTGQLGDDIGSYKESLVLEPKQNKDMVWAIKAQDWMNKVAEDANLCLYVKAAVDETGQIFIKNKDTPIDKPDLELTASSTKVKKNDPVDITVTFTNPLNIPINKGVFTVEGSGIEDKTIILGKAIKPGATVNEKVTIRPTRWGNAVDVVATFNSRQLVGIDGRTKIKVTRQ